MKREINVMEHSTEIMEALNKGVLLTTKANGKVNSMTISWGFLGIQWARGVMITLVRENRFTKKLLDENPEFTINIPVGEFDKSILGVCGTKSGKSVDKIKELGLTLEEPMEISVPGIKELPLTLECKVIMKQKQNLEDLPKDMLDRFYPQGVDSDFHGANKDFHFAYYGEIVKAYIIE